MEPHCRGGSIFLWVFLYFFYKNINFSSSSLEDEEFPLLRILFRRVYYHFTRSLISNYSKRFCHCLIAQIWSLNFIGQNYTVQKMSHYPSNIYMYMYENTRSACLLQDYTLYIYVYKYNRNTMDIYIYLCIFIYMLFCFEAQRLYDSFKYSFFLWLTYRTMDIANALDICPNTL